MNINLHIERLVLEGLGLTRSESEEVRQYFGAELGRLCSEGEILNGITAGFETSRLSAKWTGAPTKDPQRIGERLAHSVYGGLGDSRQKSSSDGSTQSFKP
jgi:hypothetical protein